MGNSILFVSPAAIIPSVTLFVSIPRLAPFEFILARQLYASPLPVFFTSKVIVLFLPPTIAFAPDASVKVIELGSTTRLGI